MISLFKNAHPPSVYAYSTVQEVGALLQELANASFESIASLEEVQQQIFNAATNVEHATVSLSDRFKQLTAAAQSQREILQEILQVMGAFTVDNQNMGVREFITLLNETLQNVVEKILFVSKKSMLMVYRMDDAMKTLQTIDTFAKSIRSITNQTSILAINATIEAARIDDAGNGFFMVAEEVRGISEEIEVLSEKIHDRVQDISKQVKSSHDMLQEVATIDISDNILIKKQLNACMDDLINQNDGFQGNIQAAAETAEILAHTISAMVMDLQFQDRNTQVAENSCGILAQHTASLKAWVTQLEQYSAQKGNKPAHKVVMPTSIDAQPLKKKFWQRYTKNNGVTALDMNPVAPVQEHNNRVTIDVLLGGFSALQKVEKPALQLLTELFAQSSVVVETTATTLTSNFQKLAMGAKRQGEIVQEMADTAGLLQVNGKQISLQEFTTMLYKMLDYSIENILFVSKKIVTMILSMESTIESLAEIQLLTSDIQKITHKTNTLSMNATMEAMRVGEAGRSFVVVAKEVREISKAVSVFSTGINQAITSLTQDIQSTFVVLKEVMAVDMSENIMVKEKIDTCMNAILSQNDHFKTAMQQAATTSKMIAENITALASDLHFQTENTAAMAAIKTTLADDVRMLSRLGDDIALYAPHLCVNEEEMERHANNVAAGIKLGDIKQRYAEKLEQLGMPVLSITAPHNSALPADDDIELF